VLKTTWSRRSEEVKPNNEELREVKKRDQSPSLGDPGNIHRTGQMIGYQEQALIAVNAGYQENRLQ
jgi:hypothetical protein